LQANALLRIVLISKSSVAIIKDTVAETVIPRACGVSSTPQLFDSITNVSEYWIVRSSRTMTVEYDAAFSRHELPELLHDPCPFQ
jgi:hypothetical protein